MTRLFNSLILTLALGSCVTVFRGKNAEPVQVLYKGSGPVLAVAAEALAELTAPAPDETDTALESHATR